jgi:hypothetical protein
MRTHRFGRKLKLPATVVIKHQLRMMIAQDLKNEEAEEVRRKAERQRGEALRERAVVGI